MIVTELGIIDRLILVFCEIQKNLNFILLDLIQYLIVQ